MTAKTTLRDLKKMLAPIAVNVTSTANPPSTFNLPPYPTWAGENDRVLTNAWKAYLKWEEGNPLVLEDQNALQTRIVAAYRKAVARMRFFPDIMYGLRSLILEERTERRCRLLDTSHSTL